MICKNCGREVDDEATYCYYCGKRTDGKKLCPKCGAQMPEDGLYCGVCGARVDAVNEALPHQNSEVAVAADEASPVAEAAALNWKTILKYVCYGLAGLAALFGFVFTFLIGADAEALGIGASTNIYEYFGDVYEELKNLNSSYWSDARLASVYIPAVMGTVISAAALVTTFVFAVITIVAAVKKFAYKNQSVNFVKPALLTYFSFAAFATLFLALSSASVTSVGSSASVTVSAKFNGATLAGLAVGGVAVGALCVLKVVLRIAQRKMHKTDILPTVFAVVAGVFAVIVTALSAYPVGSITQSGNSVSMGYMSLVNSVSSYAAKTSDVDAIIACGTVGFAVQGVILALAVKTVWAAVSYVCCGKKQKLLGEAIPCVVLAAANVALAVVCTQAFKSFKDVSDAASLGYGAPIAILVLSVLALVAVICLKVFEKNNARQNALPVSTAQAQ